MLLSPCGGERRFGQSEPGSPEMKMGNKAFCERCGLEHTEENEVGEVNEGEFLGGDLCTKCAKVVGLVWKDAWVYPAEE
jgi:hypothetical protein